MPLHFFRYAGRALIAMSLAVLSAIAAAYVVLEVHLWWYMREHNVVLRSDLEDDYNLGFHSVLLGIGAILIVLPLTGWMFWRLTRRLPMLMATNTSVEAASNVKLARRSSAAAELEP